MRFVHRYPLPGIPKHLYRLFVHTNHRFPFVIWPQIPFKYSFHRPSKTAHLVALEMVQGNQDIRIHDRPAYPGGFTVDSAGNRNFQVIGAFKPVGDDVLAACG
jgi:hypothetical protein